MNALSGTVGATLGQAREDERYVLIVDDDRDFAESLQDLLGTHQYHVRIANSSQEALRVLMHYPARVVLLDIRLGMQSGIRLLDEIRASMPAVMCIMITAYSSVDTAIEALRRGAYDYLAKPIRAEVLMASLEKCFERIRLERERDVAQKNLAASESRYRQLIEDSSAVSWEMDVHSWTFRYLGRQIEKLTGIPLKSWLSEGFFLEMVHDDDLDMLKQAMKSSVRNGSEELEFRLTSKDDSLIWVRCIIDVRDDDDSGIAHGYLFDITDQVNSRLAQTRLQNQLNQAKRMEAIGYLTGGVAHDFNNILSSIIGYTDLSLERLHLNDFRAMERYLLEVRSAGEKARNLVGRMLVFSRGVSGETHPVKLMEMVSHSMPLVKASLPNRLTLSLEGTSSHDKVSVDPVQIQQLLMNLCINARDAIDGQGLITIQVMDAKPYVNECASCHRSIMGEYACLSVTDSGSGMSEEVLGRIFDPFFTTKALGQGSGLGLSIIHGIVHEYGGHLLAESQPGAGTRFRILLPVVQNQRVISASDKKDNAAVILVEDDMDSASAYKHAMELSGYSVIHYATANDVLSQDIASMESQVVIVDHSLADINGIELIQRLRAKGLTQTMLLYTKDTRLLGDDSVALKKGVDRVIRRPETPASLVEVIDSHLKRREGPH